MMFRFGFDVCVNFVFKLCVFLLKIVRDNPVARFAARFKLLSHGLRSFKSWLTVGQTVVRHSRCWMLVDNRTRRGDELH